MKIEFSEEEMAWLYSGLPMNSTTMSRAVPHQKLRELLDFKAQCEVSARLITNLQETISEMRLNHRDGIDSGYF